MLVSLSIAKMLMGICLITADVSSSSRVTSYFPLIVGQKVLRGIEFTGTPYKVNISGLGIKSIDRNALEGLASVTELNLSNNNIQKLPELIFSNLTNLKYLSLAGNRIQSTTKVFYGLVNLKTLNIKNNPLTDILDDHYFAGLTKRCSILISGAVGIKAIGTHVFGRESLSPLRNSRKRNEINSGEGDSANHSGSRSTPCRNNGNNNFSGHLCLNKGEVNRVKLMQGRIDNCREIDFSSTDLLLNDLGITSFKSGWYRLFDTKDIPACLSGINLSNNNIAQVTSDVINDLPGYIRVLRLDNNRIESLKKYTFMHSGIRSLDLGYNLLENIEYGTFQMPNLYQLFLWHNRLKDSEFFDALPPTLTSLHLGWNSIKEINAATFIRMERLDYLDLRYNKITTLGPEVLHGATGLRFLLLSFNEIENISVDAFRDLRNLEKLELNNNHIKNLRSRTFRGLDNVKSVNLRANQLTKITKDVFDMGKLSFLNLADNNITLIGKKALRKLGQLLELDISKNPIKKLQNGALSGMSKVKRAYVRVEETPLEMIQVGMFDSV